MKELIVAVNDIPGEESLTWIPHEKVVDYNKLIPFREKYNAGEILDFIIQHRFFKINSWTELGMSSLEGEALKFCNCINSLLVTWDHLALASCEKILSYKPGDFVIKFISYSLIESNFPDKELLIDFTNNIQKNYPSIALQFKDVKETAEYYIKNNLKVSQRKKATPAEELRKQE